jgi:hypothetical protein
MCISTTLTILLSSSSSFPAAGATLRNVVGLREPRRAAAGGARAMLRNECPGRSLAARPGRAGRPALAFRLLVDRACGCSPHPTTTSSSFQAQGEFLALVTGSGLQSQTAKTEIVHALYGFNKLRGVDSDFVLATAALLAKALALSVRVSVCRERGVSVFGVVVSHGGWLKRTDLPVLFQVAHS